MQAFVILIKQVESEADYMLMEAGERETSPEQQREHIERINQQSNATIFVAVQEREVTNGKYEETEIEGRPVQYFEI